MATPVYPATNNAEAIELNISNANQFFTVLQGGVDDFITTYEGEGEIPSVAKALHEAAAYKTPLQWQTTGEQTDILQPRVYDNAIYVPLEIPAPFGAFPDNQYWRLYSSENAQILIENLTFTGDGTTTDFNIPSMVVEDPAAYLVNIDGVEQRPTIDYTIDVSTDTLSFVEAPPETTPDNISVTVLGALRGALADGIYETLQDGLDNTFDDSFFHVVNESDPEVFIDLYRNDSGVGTLIASYPNSVAYDNFVNEITATIGTYGFLAEGDNASDVPYDNTSSVYSSENVQGALDENGSAATKDTETDGGSVVESSDIGTAAREDIGTMDSDLSTNEQRLRQVDIDMTGGSDVTLTESDSTADLINLTGTLTADVALIVPDTARKYTIINSTSGSFTVTVKTAAGTGVVVPQGQARVLRSDGADVVYVAGDPEAGFTGNFSTNGYQKLPSGLIIQWGIVSVAANNVQTDITLPVTFPNAGLQIVTSPNGINNSNGVPGAEISDNSTASFWCDHGNAVNCSFFAVGY